MVGIRGWEGFSLAHPFLVMMFDVIIYGSSDFLYTVMDGHQKI